MNITNRLGIIGVFFIGCGTPPVASPLFDADETLVLTIEAPMRELIKKRLDKVTYDAVVRFTDPVGQQHVFDAQLSSRGNARLDACDFPPLRLIFKKKVAVGTVFEGQDRIKIVTQCNTSRGGESWLLQELGIYRAYNILTDFSFRTRRLDVTYIDSESARWQRNQPAFFIEPTGELAARTGHDSIRPPSVAPSQINRSEVAINLLFQLMIANTDFSVKRGPNGEGCCHNGRVVTVSGERENWIIVPYDFDQAGIINTSYALPDKRLGIRAVNIRKYRGFCWHNEALPEAMNLFRERRVSLVAALTPPELSASRQKRVRRFLDRFYGILDDPKELQKRIMDECRGPETFSIRKTTNN